MRRHVVLITSCWLAQAGFVAPVHADFIPTHGATVHLDPFIPGWPVPPAFPAPPAGVVVPGDGAGADPEYDVLGPSATDTLFGTDGLDSPLGNWHWEIEIDLDPYGGLPGAVAVAFDFALLGGPVLGPFAVPIAAGPDIYIHVDQPDHNNLSGFGETGSFSKSLFNLTPDPVAWGTSVTEDPTPSVDPPGVHTPWFDLEKDRGFGAWTLEPADGGGFVITQLPEPGSLSLLGLAMVAALVRRRKK